MAARHLTSAIQTEGAGVNWIIQRIVPARNDGSNSSADRTFAHHELALSANDCDVTNFHARDVGNAIELGWRTVEWNADIPCPNRYPYFNPRFRL
jgi:hypothetical protein